MPEPRARLLVGARAATGAIGIVIGVGVVAAATFLPLPTVVLAPASVTVVPVPSTAQLVCPGAVLRLGDESGANATEASAIASAASTRGATSGEVESRALAATAAGGGVGAPTALLVPAGSDASIAGAQSQSVATSDYRGFTAAECARPSSDAWLVGGSTAVGRTTLLTIANPGAVASTVTLQLYTEDGLVDAPGTNGIVVAAGSQRVLSLAGFAASVESLAVHVTSRGGPVVANLQQSVVRGIDPGGVEIIGSTTAPATRQVIPGVIVSNAAELAGMLGLEGYEDLDTVLRVLVPGDAAARASVRIRPSAADGTGTSFDLSLDAGVITDIPIDDLEDGHYSVEIDSDVPVVGALRVATVADGDADLAWFAAAAALTGDSFLAVAPGPSATLSLTNSGSAAVSASLDGVAFTLPGGSSVSLDVGDGATHLLSGATGLYASVGYAGAAKLGAYTLSASATTEPPVTVYP